MKGEGGGAKSWDGRDGVGVLVDAIAVKTLRFNTFRFIFPRPKVLTTFFLGPCSN